MVRTPTVLLCMVLNSVTIVNVSDWMTLARLHKLVRYLSRCVCVYVCEWLLYVCEWLYVCDWSCV